MAGDGSLAPMADWLRRAGYRPSKAGMLSNIGCAGTGHDRLEQRLERLVAEQGQRAVVIGQSRGGSMAKVLAVRRPDLVCGLVTLGSPHVEPLAVHPVVRAGVEAVSRLGSLGVPGLFKRGCLDGECCATFWQDLAAPTAPGVGFVAVYSRSDGIVDWRACLDPVAHEQVEIASSHCGMAVSPAAWWAVAKALDRFGRAEARRKKARKEPVRRLRRVA
jgi:pimeloyl-ACP methyl ester carboxylesterase